LWDSTVREAAEAETRVVLNWEDGTMSHDWGNALETRRGWYFHSLDV